MKGEHGWNPSLREATATFMAKHLRGEDREIHEPAELEILSAEEIQVTPTGEVLDLEGARYGVRHFARSAGGIARAAG